MSATPSRPSRSTTPAAANGSAQQTQNVELKDMAAGTQKVPIEEDLMQLARLGEIKAVQKLFDQGKYDANSADEQGITPLHWAAINNHYALCHFLIQSGANVNAKGGDALATPVLWAAKRCHYYIVDLLLQHGADPLLTDDQGFNLLHSATLDGNVFQLVLLLHQDLQVDIPDTHGHTALMWAAYKGYPAVVDLFLNWGSNVYARDDQGFTALHWSLVKGSLHGIQKLIEYGSDRFAETNDGKTPVVVAKEMNSIRPWHRALSECGYHPDGSAKTPPFPLSMVKDRRTVLRRFFFLWPFAIVFCSLYVLSHMVVYAAVPISLIVCYGLQLVAVQALKWAPTDMRTIHKTPFLSGVFAGTLFLVGVRWLTAVLPKTYKSALFLNLIFFALYSLCAYFYFTTMFADPGYVPKAGSRSAQKAVINELIEARQFDEQHFCVRCMIRKPLRSKHCFRCNRCVAKEDHHCPWVDNCVANNNHRHFVLYIITLELGILAFIRLVIAYLDSLPDAQSVECNIINASLCKILNRDPYTIVLSCWSALQLTWVTMLVIVQLLQVARAQTTYEAMRGHTHADPVTSFVTTGTTSAGEAQIASEPQPRKKEGCWDQWKRILGVDAFLQSAVRGSRGEQVRRQRRENPFTRGMIRNCLDFWRDPAPVFGKRGKEVGEALLDGERVDYARLYVPPPRLRGGRSSGRYEAVGEEEP